MVLSVCICSGKRPVKRSVKFGQKSLTKFEHLCFTMEDTIEIAA